MNNTEKIGESENGESLPVAQGETKDEAVEVSQEQRSDFLRRLRDARALLLQDSESFHIAATALEHVGQVIRRRIGNGLNAYRNPIINFATQDGYFEWNEVEKLFDTVMNARNDVVHGGAYVRQLSSRLIELILVLEEVCMSTLKHASDLMVANPTSADYWENVATIRRELLSNSFSHIPVRDSPASPWKVVSDLAVLRYMGGTNKKNRTELLSQTIADAIQMGVALPDEAMKRTLEAIRPPTCSANDLVDDIRDDMNHFPTLVVTTHEGEERLMGIITPFDLL